MQIYMKDGKALKIDGGGGYLAPKASGETWLLNENLNTGNATYRIDFTSNNTRYTTLTIQLFARSRLKYDNTLVNGDRGAGLGNGWINQAYRTITFDTAPTGNLLTWLQANGTKQ